MESVATTQVHSPGTEELSFLRPSELDTASGIPDDEVVDLLREAPNRPDFY
jgi:hypothetical protein